MRESELSPISRVIVAVKISDTADLRRVLKSNPELVNSRDENGMTPLHLACKWQKLPAVDVLLEFGADTSLKDHLGYTPEKTATWYGESANGAYTDTCQQIVQRLRGHVDTARSQ